MSKPFYINDLNERGQITQTTEARADVRAQSIMKGRQKPDATVTMKRILSFLKEPHTLKDVMDEMHSRQLPTRNMLNQMSRDGQITRTMTSPHTIYQTRKMEGMQ
jgi:hypothetical protein